MQIHWCHLAYLWWSERAVGGLARLFPMDTLIGIELFRVGSTFQAVLCVDIERLDEAPDGLTTEIAGIDSSAFDEFMRATVDPWYGDEEGLFVEVQSRVRALIWLSQQTDAPIGYWHHLGNNGLEADCFIGVGPRRAMWSNDRERQDSDWDENKPRGAYTAALWHIGAPESNKDEYDTGTGAVGEPKFSIAELSADLISSLVTNWSCRRWQERGEAS